MSTNVVQILHVRGNHWVMISNLLCRDNEMKCHDTIYNDVDKQTQDLLNNMFDEDVTVTVDTQVQKQKGDIVVFLHSYSHFTLT